MRFPRPLAGALGLLGLGCVIVALAGRGTIDISSGASLTVPALDGAGRWGLGVLGLALIGLAGFVWFRPQMGGGPAPATPRSIVDGCVTVHYHRPDGRYDDWRLHVYGDGLAPDAPADWPGAA